MQYSQRYGGSGLVNETNPLSALACILVAPFFIVVWRYHQGSVVYYQIYLYHSPAHQLWNVPSSDCLHVVPVLEISISVFFDREITKGWRVLSETSFLYGILDLSY